MLAVVYCVPAISQRNTNTDATQAKREVVIAIAAVLKPVDLQTARDGDKIQTHATYAHL